MKTINIYTDGACRGNPGPGGWGAIILYGSKESILLGGNKHTTNNAMELASVVSSLKHILSIATKPYIINIYSDSAYVCNAITQRWIHKWAQNNWKTTKKPARKQYGGQSYSTTIKNSTLWIDLFYILKDLGKRGFKVNFIKVKGHSDNELNNRVDSLAVNVALEYKNGQRI